MKAVNLKVGSINCESGKYENLISFENLFNHSSLLIDNLNIADFISCHYETC